MGVLSKHLDYSFKIDKGKPELEVVKSDAETTETHPKKAKKVGSKKLTDYQMIQMNPTMAPMIELGDILKEFTKVMKHKKKHKKVKDNKPNETDQVQINQESNNTDKRKLNVVVDNTPQPTQNNNTVQTTNPPNRKAFGLDSLGGAGGIGAMAAVGGGAVLAGGMAAGSAENEGLEQEIMAKENTFGIMKIQEKVNDDINMELFSSSIHFKGLREKAKTVLMNGESKINETSDLIENALGTLHAIDKQLITSFNENNDD
jgi:hypothetical protein